MTWKNKKYFKILIIFLVGLLITKDNHILLPEDASSSGNSIVKTQVDKINNHLNVLEYDYSYENIKQHQLYCLKDIQFSFFDEIVFYQEQYVQGICIAEEYLCVTAYYEGKHFGELLIFDRINGDHLLTLGMDEKSHLGGITYDGANIWVCNSFNQSIERIPYENLKYWTQNHYGKTINITNLVDVYRVKNIPSCISYYDGCLWIATHQKWNPSIMRCYQYNPNLDMMEPHKIYRIPSKVQGIAFGDKGEIYLSTSYGRKASSHLIKYMSLNALQRDFNEWSYIVEMPPCSEGIALEKDCIYILFESAAKRYYRGTDGFGKSLAPLNRILVIWDSS